MKLITWNINSVRLRISSVERLVKEQNPDVICLQETKTPDEHFPLEAIKSFGYEHVCFAGMKGYNGVAIISKFPITGVEVYDRCGKTDCRHILAKIKMPNIDADVHVHNIYIPAGGDEPDVKINEKFKHKLDFIDELTEYFSQNYKPTDSVIVVGDMNIAPLENDVWSHKQLLKIVSHTPIEVEKLTEFYKSIDWVDAMRHFVPEDEKLYSWWSYRSKDWKKSNRGRRLDHIWVTPFLKPHLKQQIVLTDIRSWERPSDHAPVMVEIEV